MRSGKRCRNCDTEHHAKAGCAPHWPARKAGWLDRIEDQPGRSDRWPAGQYGHADYWIGYFDGPTIEVIWLMGELLTAMRGLRDAARG